MKTMYLGNQMHVMIQPLRGDDGPHLPHSLSVVSMYTEVIFGSKWVPVVVKNLTVVPITTAKGIKVTQVMAANVMPPVDLAPRTLEELDEVQGIQQTRVLVDKRKEVLLQQIDLSGLDGWSEANQVPTCSLLANNHDIFLLEPGELSCTDLAKYKIRIVDDETFKEQFQRIPLPMVDEFQAHEGDVGSRCNPPQSKPMV